MARPNAADRLRRRSSPGTALLMRAGWNGKPDTGTLGYRDLMLILWPGKIRNSMMFIANPLRHRFIIVFFFGAVMVMDRRVVTRAPARRMGRGVRECPEGRVVPCAAGVAG